LKASLPIPNGDVAKGNSLSILWWSGYGIKVSGKKVAFIVRATFLPETLIPL
jgi:hypothetical protein